MRPAVPAGIFSSTPSSPAATSADVVVIGAGHHALVAAAGLADAGLDVIVLESRESIGGAVSSFTAGEFVVDHCSAFHPLALASPALSRLGLEDFGLAWSHAERPLAHLTREGFDQGDARIEPEAEATAALLDTDHPGDGAAWMRLVETYRSLRAPLLDALLTQWPPTTTGLRLARQLGTRDLIDFARFALLPVTRMGAELFGGRLGRDLLTGNAMHADIPPDAPGSGIYGWLMTMLAQDVGFPAPVGGAQALADALAARAAAAGAQIRTGQHVTEIVVRGRRPVGVRTRDGGFVRARRAVVADTTAPALYADLLPPDAVPAGVRARLERFEWDSPVVKLNYLLREPMPWRSEAARGAGVVHVGPGAASMALWSAELACGAVPSRPFVLIGQMTTADSLRSPAGTESMWVYGHVPRAAAGESAVSAFIDSVTTSLEEFAPGWSEAVSDLIVQTPASLHADNPNLSHGSIAGGTMQLFQQGPWRPLSGLGGPRTHLPGLYLGSAAIHPGGGVHGACGALAAQAVIADAGGITGRVRARVATTATRSMLSRPPRF